MKLKRFFAWVLINLFSQLRCREILILILLQNMYYGFVFVSIWLFYELWKLRHEYLAKYHFPSRLTSEMKPEKIFLTHNGSFGQTDLFEAQIVALRKTAFGSTTTMLVCEYAWALIRSDELLLNISMWAEISHGFQWWARCGFHRSLRQLPSLDSRTAVFKMYGFAPWIFKTVWKYAKTE